MAYQFSEETICQAKETSLTELAAYYGFHPKRIGNTYTLEEYDSIRIYNDRTWYRWSKAGSRGEDGGSQIDFLMQFCGVESTYKAIRVLLDFQGISYAEGERMQNPQPGHLAKQPLEQRKTAAFVLPEPVEGNYRRAYAYLMKTRGLSQRVIDYFVKDLKILYEEKEHHNLVFLGKDREGKVRYATKRGTADIYGKKYRGDVAGNNKNYGINIINLGSDELKVFEANIDLMSYMDVTGDYESNKLVLGMVADNPLAQFLRDYQHIRKITFCMDNDESGMNAMYGKQEAVPGKAGKVGLIEKYASQGYQTRADIVPKETGSKDWNEYLLYLKKQAPKQERQIRRKSR